MAKVGSGRLDGLYGMESFTAEELHAHADQLEARAADPADADAPGWLRRRAARLRRVASQKERAAEHKDRRADHSRQQKADRMPLPVLTPPSQDHCPLQTAAGR